MRHLAQRNLTKLVKEAKKLASYPGIDWASSCWDITQYDKRRAHDKRRLNLHFARVRVTRSCPYIALPPEFSDFAKAMIRTRASEKQISWGSQKAMLDALRRILECLIVSGRPDPSNLLPMHFENVLIQAQAHSSHNYLYTLGVLLEEIASFINYYQLTNCRISFRNPVRHPRQADGTDKQSQEVGLRKMPSKTALIALAQASNNPVDDNERIILRTIDLLVVGNFRIGEVLTLPEECWVKEITNRKGPKQVERNAGQLIRYGLRYWPEKGGEPIVKWLPDAAVPIARRAVTDLKNLCADARRVAKVVARNNGRVKLDGLASHECVDRATLQKVFGLSYGGLRLFEQYCGLTVLNPGRGPHRNLYNVGDIETALTSRMCKLQVVRKPDGSYQMLSDSLCVVFTNQFKTKKPTYKFLPELLTYKQIYAALGNDTWAISVFSRRGLKEPDGSRMRIRTHAFRHYCNTLADRGGLSDLELALWSGRRDVRQNSAYKHGTVEQRLQWARDMLRKGNLYGTISTTYAGINDPVEKETFLVTFVNAAHFTPYGVCVHDFAAEPCQYHLNCLAGCPEYLRTKGDPEERKELIQIKRFVTAELRKAENAMTKGAFNANSWVNYNRRLKANTEAALAVDDVETSNGTIDRTLIPVFK